MFDKEWIRNLKMNMQEKISLQQQMSNKNREIRILHKELFNTDVGGEWNKRLKKTMQDRIFLQKQMNNKSKEIRQLYNELLEGKVAMSK